MAEDKLPGISKTREQSKLTGKQQAQNFAGKQIIDEVASNKKIMEKLIESINENTEEQKKETETATTVLDTSQLLDKLDMSALQKEFQSAKQILENPKATPEEQSLALQQIEVIKENAISEEERREQQKKEDEANSILLQIANGVDATAKGLEDFVGNALQAGGLLATALLLIDPETFFNILTSAIEGVSAIISSIGDFIDGDFSAGFEKIKNNLGAVLGVITTGILVFIGPILKLVSGTARFFKSIVNFFKNFGKNMSKLGKVFKFIGKLVGRIFLPITALVFAIKGLVKGFQKEGSIGEKITAGLSAAVGGILDFILGIPKKALSGLLGLLGFDAGAEAVNNFSFTEFIANIGEWASGFISNLWTNIKTGISNGLENIGNALGNAGDFLQKIADFLHQTVANVWQSIKDSFSDGLERAGNFLSGIGSAISNFIKSILRAVLPDPDAERGLFDPVNLVVKAIPDSVYEYAGLNPETGDPVSSDMDISSPLPTGGDNLLQGSQANEQGNKGLTQQNLITQVTTSAPSDNSSRTNVAYSQASMSPTSGDLASARR